MQTTVSSKGQIVLPAQLREQDAIRPGERFEVERIQAGQYLLKKVRAGGSPGVVDWLRSCPEKDWFRPIESESSEEMAATTQVIQEAYPEYDVAWGSHGGFGGGRAFGVE